MRFIEARDEQNAVAMAEGYARAMGDIGLGMVGRRPEIAQTGTFS
jgi:thiamine pyrophosphate-dependent acetolactate synthase large subunit-like protein